MKLKYYAFVPDSKTACDYYKNLFEAEVIKDGQGSGHVYMKLFGQIGLHINSIKKMDSTRGKLIIRFDEEDREMHERLLERIKKTVDLQINRFDEAYLWGTSLTEILDKYGYLWVFEIAAKG